MKVFRCFRAKEYLMRFYELNELKKIYGINTEDNFIFEPENPLKHKAKDGVIIRHYANL